MLCFVYTRDVVRDTANATAVRSLKRRDPKSCERTGRLVVRVFAANAFSSGSLSRLSRFRALGCLVLLLGSGCATLPDTKPFAEATVALRGAVQSSGAAVVSELKMTQLPNAAQQAATLESAWTERNRAMSALVEYASSLESITAAGEGGAGAAKKVFDAAGELVSALGASSFGAGAGVQLARDTFVFANEQIAKARAAKSLEESLAALQPAIDRVAQLFATDFTALHQLAVLALRAERDALQSANEREIAYRNQLLVTRRTLMPSIQTELGEKKSPLALSAAKELEQVDELLAHTETWFNGYKQEEAAIQNRERLTRELIATTRSAFEDWSAVHQRMLTAVRTKRIPDAAEVIVAAGQIKTLVERYRSL